MKIDLDAIQARLAQQEGLDPEAIAKLVPGAVYEIEDALVHFPENPVRDWHDGRRVIAVQAREL